MDEIEPAAVIPLAEIRDRVAADWTEARTAEALSALAEGYRAEIAGGLPLADLAARLGRTIETARPVARGGAAPNLPATIMTDIFAGAEGDVAIEADGADVILARLTVIEPFDPALPENGALLESLRSQYGEQIAGDTLALFVAALRNRSGVTVNESLIETTLTQFQ